MAHTDSERRTRQWEPQHGDQQLSFWSQPDGCSSGRPGSGPHVSDTDRGDAQGLFDGSTHEEEWKEPKERSTGLSVRGLWPNWPPEPAVCRVANGVAHRVDRITALGNGQAPRVP